MGSSGQAVGVERAGMVGDGIAVTVGLAGAVDTAEC